VQWRRPVNRGPASHQVFLGARAAPPRWRPPPARPGRGSALRPCRARTPAAAPPARGPDPGPGLPPGPAQYRWGPAQQRGGRPGRRRRCSPSCSTARPALTAACICTALLAGVQIAAVCVVRPVVGAVQTLPGTEGAGEQTPTQERGGAGEDVNRQIGASGWRLTRSCACCLCPLHIFKCARSSLLATVLPQEQGAECQSGSETSQKRLLYKQFSCT